MSVGRLADHVIRVEGAGALAGWYNTVMGMAVTQLDTNTWGASYPGDSVRLVFKEAAAGGKKYHSSQASCYWKIGVCVADVDLARERILKQGTSVSPPNQFQEIGYLCHLQDPRGFTIELLQQTFQKNFVKPQEERSLTLGQPAVVGQITTRSTNIEKCLELYRDKLGMKLLSIQDVSNYGFCLYFLAFTCDSPPCPADLHSVANREWLWQRPYTTLEVQYKPGASPCTPMTEEGEGVDHILVEVGEETYSKVAGDLKDGGKYVDPDGVRLEIKKI